MTDEIDALRALECNHVFLTGSAERVGIPRMRLCALARDGLLVQLARGVWTTTQDGSVETRHILRTVGILQRLTSQTAADGGSALLLHGLPAVSLPLHQVHLVRNTTCATRVGRGYTVWGRRESVTTTTAHALLDQPVAVAPVASAVVHAGLGGAPITALAAADQAIRSGAMTTEDLSAAIAAVPRGRRGVGQVRAALALADGRRESPAESLAALVLHQLGVTASPQVEIGRYRVDFLIDGSRVVIEVDGAAKYADRRDLLAEKRREDDLRARGYTVVRLMWGDLLRPAIVRAKLDAALALAA